MRADRSSAASAAVPRWCADRSYESFRGDPVTSVLFFLPTVWCTWCRRDLRVSLSVHVIGNTIGQLLGLIAIAAGLA